MSKINMKLTPEKVLVNCMCCTPGAAERSKWKLIKYLNDKDIEGNEGVTE